MPKYGFPLTGLFPYKARIYDSVFIRKNLGQRKPVFWYILRTGRTAESIEITEKTAQDVLTRNGTSFKGYRA